MRCAAAIACFVCLVPDQGLYSLFVACVAYGQCAGGGVEWSTGCALPNLQSCFCNCRPRRRTSSLLFRSLHLVSVSSKCPRLNWFPDTSLECDKSDSTGRTPCLNIQPAPRCQFPPHPPPEHQQHNEDTNRRAPQGCGPANIADGASGPAGPCLLLLDCSCRPAPHSGAVSCRAAALQKLDVRRCQRLVRGRGHVFRRQLLPGCHPVRQ